MCPVYPTPPRRFYSASLTMWDADLLARPPTTPWVTWTWWCRLTSPLRMVKAMAANRKSTRMRSNGRQISFMLWACWACVETPASRREAVCHGQVHRLKRRLRAEEHVLSKSVFSTDCGCENTQLKSNKKSPVHQADDYAHTESLVHVLFHILMVWNVNMICINIKSCKFCSGQNQKGAEVHFNPGESL